MRTILSAITGLVLLFVGLPEAASAAQRSCSSNAGWNGTCVSVKVRRGNAAYVPAPASPVLQPDASEVARYYTQLLNMGH